MQKFLTSLALALICCSSIAQITQNDKKTVVSSASMIWDMVTNIAGDKVVNKLIVPIGGDPHIYEPSPSDAQKVATADLIFINGLTFEGWVVKLIKNSGTKGKTITVTDGLTPISSSVYDNAYDPHAWMDLSLAQTYITNIKDGLIELDPANKEYYLSNYETYAQKLIDLDKYILNRVQEIPEHKRVLITSHDAFRYYGKRYGIRVEGVIGISTESEAQTSDMIRVVKAIKDSGVPAIFVETTINPKLLQQIAKDNDVAIGGSLYADSIGERGTAGESFYDMMKSNTDLIVDALTKDKINSTKENGTDSSATLPYFILAGFLLLGLLLFIFKMNK